MTNYDLGALIAAKREQQPPIVVALPDGGSITIDPPLLWPDDALDAVNQNDWVAAARCVIGDDYDRWIANGGNVTLLSTILEEYGQGVTLPESQASTDS